MSKRIIDKKTLKFYIMADYMMNRGYFSLSLKQRVIEFFAPDYIMRFLRLLRKTEYLYNSKGFFDKVRYFVASTRKRRLEILLGFSISKNVFGYGLVIPHNGTIVVGSGNLIGNYAVLHTSTCITAGQKVIGNGFYLSSGEKVVHDISLGDGVSVGANSLVNRSCAESNVLLAGMPAKVLKETEPWYIRDGESFAKRREKCESLKREMNL